MDGHTLFAEHEVIELEWPTPIACMYEDPAAAMLADDMLEEKQMVRYRLLLVQPPKDRHWHPVYLHEGTSRSIVEVGGHRILPLVEGDPLPAIVPPGGFDG